MAKDIKLKRKTVRKHPGLIVKKKDSKETPRSDCQKKKTVRKHPGLIVKKKDGKETPRSDC